MMGIHLGVVGLLGAALALAVGCSTTPTIDTCEDLVPFIIDLSEEHDSVLTPRILKIRSIVEVERDHDRLICRGSAVWSRGGPSDIVFEWTTDEDGDGFIGYRRQ